MLLAILATLSILIIELAEALTRCSLLILPVIPGKGRISRVQTSDNKFSSRTLSARGGASTGIRLVVRRDWDLFMLVDEADWEISFKVVVFLISTWHSDDFGPTVVALWIEIRRAIVPSICQTLPYVSWAKVAELFKERLIVLPGFPKTVPSGLISKDKLLNRECSNESLWSLSNLSVRWLLHSSSSFGEQALSMTSYNWWSLSKTSFHENGAVWHWRPNLISCRLWIKSGVIRRSNF